MKNEIDRLLDDIVATRMSIEAELWVRVEECSSILKEIAPANRKPWLNSVKQRICLEQDYRCGICGEILSLADTDIDHIVPIFHGGGNERPNLRATHSSCNRSRGTSMELIPLLRYLEDRYMNLPPAERLALGLQGNPSA